MIVKIKNKPSTEAIEKFARQLELIINKQSHALDLHGLMI